MDKNLYKTMQKILENSNSKDADVTYLGAITMKEYMPIVGNVEIGKDIFVLADIASDGSVVFKYYDEDNVCIAGRGTDGELFPTQEKLNDNLDFLNQIDELEESKELSLKEMSKTIDNVCKLLGLEKNDVLSMSSIELDKAIDNKEDDKYLDLSEEENTDLSPEMKDEYNNEALENLTSKQEVKASTKTDAKSSLADKLGLKEGDTLIIVDSDKIRDNNNTTPFTPIVRHADGSIDAVKNLLQVGGEHSDKNVYETTRDGKKVEKKFVQSSFCIDGLNNEILTIKRGQMGTIEVGYGGTDISSHRDAFTHRLETTQLYSSTARVREEFGPNKGVNNISEKIDEIKEHEKHGCKDLSLDEADGNPYTGHFHSDEAADIILDDKDAGKKIDHCFTKDEVIVRFESMKEKNPDLDFDGLVELTKEELLTDAEFMHSREL